MNLRHFVLAAAAAALLCACSSSNEPIKTKVPPRPAGAECVIGLATDPIDTVRIGVVGLGMRGTWAVERLTYVPGVKITALCDLIPAQVEGSQDILKNFGLPQAEGYSGEEESWKGLCESENVDLVYICTDWVHHAPIALYAMQCGKHVAIEVPAALDLDEIWALIDMAETTKLHCIMLENCVYDFYEMSTLAMAQAGVFGEVIHGEGSYQHNLDPFWDGYWNNWRMEYNKNHRGDVYPTHGIGPVCQALNIHRGDRMKTLVSMDTKAFNGSKLFEKHTGVAYPDYANGDQTCTLISTEQGKTILIEHDVVTPRPYSRMYQLVGTMGFASKYPTELYCLGEEPEGEIDAKDIIDEKVYLDDELAQLQAQYPIPILTPELKALAEEVGGHGGMDFIMDYRMIYCLRNGLPMDMDVYDLAEWCCVSPLSKLSIENGNRPVEIPDFTRGNWDKQKGFSYAFAK
jgi:predicted dehydrogenase